MPTALSPTYVAELRKALAHWDAIVLDHWAHRADRANAAMQARSIRQQLRNITNQPNDREIT